RRNDTPRQQARRFLLLSKRALLRQRAAPADPLGAIRLAERRRQAGRGTDGVLQLHGLEAQRRPQRRSVPALIRSPDFAPWTTHPKPRAAASVQTTLAAALDVSKRGAEKKKSR